MPEDAFRLLVAHVVTCDPALPRAEAVLIGDGRIVAVGALAELQRRAPDAAREDLRGTLVPGFIDPHHHFLLGALDQGAARLRPPAGTPVAELLRLVAGHTATQAAADPDAQWVRLHGYDPRGLAERRPPTRAELDAVCPDRPLILISYSWHEAVLNSAGFAAMGWPETVRDPEVGRFVRDRQGRLTGEVRELPAYLAEAASRTPMTRSARDRWLLGAERHGARLLEQGIVRVADAAVPPEFDDLYLQAAQDGRLPVTVHRMAVASEALCRPRPVDQTVPGPARTPAAAVKLILDGGDECAVCLSTWQVAQAAAVALRAVRQGQGRETVRAGLRAGIPHRADGAWQRGVRFWRPAELGAHVRAAAEHGLPVALHAIGNQAVRDALDALQPVAHLLHDLPAPARIEHAMFLDADLISRLRDSGVHAVVQPSFLTEQGDDLGHLPLPPDLRLMPFQTLRQQGVPLALSSDFPVADCDPIAGMRAAVGRRSQHGLTLDPDQALTPEQALRGYTLSAAASLGVDDQTGSISPGKQADLVLLTHDPTTPDGLASSAWSRTWLAGTSVAGCQSSGRM